MPHLSPMHWIIMLASIWSTLLMIVSMYWWSQSMKWPQSKTSNMIKSYHWSWF